LTAKVVGLIDLKAIVAIFAKGPDFSAKTTMLPVDFYHIRG
jgi:hypothetical protein